MLLDRYRSDSDYKQLPGQPFRVPEFHFPHAACILGGNVQRRNTREAAAILEKWYRGLLIAADLSLSDTLSAPAHNVIVTNEFMFVVGRSRENWRGFNVNALGYAGLFLIKGHQAFSELHTVGPMEVLRGCASVNVA